MILQNLFKMKPILLSSLNEVNAAVKILCSGGVVAVPTDTVYGLACCATNVNAISKMYSIKSRDEHKPVAICVGQISEVKKWASASHLPNNLLKQLLPGPVTLILECNNKLDKSLVHNGKVGIRIPDCDFIRQVVQGLKFPVALTSANKSSESSTVEVDEFKHLWPYLDGVFDGGNLGDSNRGASTIVDLSKAGEFTIIRDGIALQKTVGILNTFGIKQSVC